MEIFQQELDDGLSEIISAKSSISYASLLEQSDSAKTHKKDIEIKSLASIDDSDLYYTQSILVTTSWNKNDDIFDKNEVWKARSTPTHKPTNLEHDEGSIVGHITSNWPMLEDGELLDENTDPNNLPDKFHILTGSVIYTGFTDKALKDRADKLISEIESGNKYVSMECFFKGFDYGLVDKTTGSFHVLPRNDETAFLTKHLRAYGGAGEHQNYKIGRVLRNITFSGKGFVDKPANPESIIFTKDNLNFNDNIESYEEKKDSFLETGVFSNQANLKENIMSDEPVDQPVEETVEPTAPAVEPTEEVKPEETVPETNDQAEAAKKMNEEMKKMKAELLAATEALAGYKAKEAEMMKQQKKTKRMATLVDSGVDSEVAEASIEKLLDLEDSIFETVAALVAAVKPKEKMVPKTDKNLTTEDSQNTKSAEISDVLENAEVEAGIDLSVGSDSEDETQNTRAALVDFVYSRLGKKLNKGD